MKEFSIFSILQVVQPAVKKTKGFCGVLGS